MKWRRMALGIAILPLVVVLAHFGVHATSRIPAPSVKVPALAVRQTVGVKRAGHSWVRHVGKLLEVHLTGKPEDIGTAHSLLLHDEMVETESVVWKLLDAKVTNPAARALLLDVGQFAYRNVASSLSDPVRREIAAGAAAFRPDPFSDRFDTFQRFVYLAALYDISLGYERSPLLGCTTFAFSRSGAAGSPLLARAFDFDVDDVFDEKKAVYFVTRDGTIPFASVAWPGLVGVVSGMNREGLAVVVHGARAGPTRTVGEAVVHELRRLLETSRTTEEALKAIDTTDPLVSHIVVMTDRDGNAVAVERIPGEKSYVRRLADRDVVTNHLEGPKRDDPRNLRVRETSSTLPRRERGDELVHASTPPLTASDAVAILRDRAGSDGKPLPLGDRRAIDALIATHGVVMETAAQRLWVSESPHLLGRFVAFDLNYAFADDGSAAPTHEVVLPDALLTDGTYAQWKVGHPEP
jgi:hypothetical protein